MLALPACGGGGNGEATGDEEGATDTGGADTVTPEEGAGGDRNLTAPLDELNGSGQSGRRRSQPWAKTARASSSQLNNSPGEAQPAHIHRGTCDGLDPAPAYPLENVENGRSDSEVDASLDDLQSEDFAINVHRSEAEAETYVACGDLTGGRGGSGEDDDGEGGGGY